MDLPIRPASGGFRAPTGTRRVQTPPSRLGRVRRPRPTRANHGRTTCQWLIGLSHARESSSSVSAAIAFWSPNVRRVTASRVRCAARPCRFPLCVRSSRLPPQPWRPTGRTVLGRKSSSWNEPPRLRPASDVPNHRLTLSRTIRSASSPTDWRAGDCRPGPGGRRRGWSRRVPELGSDERLDAECLCLRGRRLRGASAVRNHGTVLHGTSEQAASVDVRGRFLRGRDVRRRRVY